MSEPFIQNLPASFSIQRCWNYASRRFPIHFRQCLLTLALSACLAPVGQAQDRLESMPGYARYRAQTRKLREVTAPAFTGAVTGAWTADSSGYIYRRDGKTYKYKRGAAEKRGNQ